MRMRLKNTFIVYLMFLIPFLNFVNASTKATSRISNQRKDVESNAKKHIKPSNPKQKNEITDALSSKKVCMNVCNPPYYNQAFPPFYGGQYNPGGGQNNPGGDQNNPGGGQFNPGGGQFYPVQGQYNPGIWNQNYVPAEYDSMNFYPGGGYEYQSLGENQFFPDGSFGDYIAGCYRNMFRRKYKLDPGFVKPTIFNYKTLVRRRYENFRRGRNNNYQDFMNCQLICYPVMIPSYTPSSTYSTTTSESAETTEENTSTTKKTSPKPTAKKSKKIKRHKGHTSA